MPDKNTCQDVEHELNKNNSIQMGLTFMPLRPNYGGLEIFPLPLRSRHVKNEHIIPLICAK